MARKLIDSGTIKIDLAEDFWIEAKQELTYGEKRALRKPFMRINPNGTIVPLTDQLEEANPVLIQLAITDWNIEDSSGNKAPINRESIDSMNEDDVKLILEALSKLYKEDAEDEKKS